MSMIPIFDGVTSYVSKDYNNTSLNCPASAFGQRNVNSQQKKIQQFGSVLGLPDNYPGKIVTELPVNPELANIRGARLPQPYGPVDNARMISGSMINSFGQNLGRSFGQTPGTDAWTSNLASKNYWGQQDAVQGSYKSAQRMPPVSNLYNSVPTQTTEVLNNLEMGLQVPANYQFGNNLLYTFGQKTKKTKQKRGNSSKNSFGSSFGNSFGNSFGSSYQGNTSTMIGSNNVAYQPSIPMYHGGSNTVNFATGQLFRSDMINGPTNSTGYYANMGSDNNLIYTVQQDINNHSGYLSTAKGINSGFPVNSYLTNGTLGQGTEGQGTVSGTEGQGTVQGTEGQGTEGQGTVSGLKNGFGSIFDGSNTSQNIIYQPEILAEGTGRVSVYQQEPPYMRRNGGPTGSYVSFGSRKKQTQKTEQKQKPKGKKQKTSAKQFLKKEPIDQKQEKKQEKKIVPILNAKKLNKSMKKNKDRPRLTNNSSSKIANKKMKLSTVKDNVVISMDASGRFSVRNKNKR